MKTWTLNGTDFEMQPIISEDCGENPLDIAVCYAGGDNEPDIKEAYKNALLMASAPKMLNALIEAEDFIKDLIGSHESEVLTEIRRILAELEGVTA